MKQVILPAIICALLGTNAMTMLEGQRLVKEAQLGISLERDIAYADGYHTALVDVTAGACKHVDDPDYAECETRFSGITARLAEVGASIQAMKEQTQ